MIAHEMLLFAMIGFLVGGLDDLVIDLIFLLRAGWLRLRGRDDQPVLAAQPPADVRFAILVPAWDEAAVIGAMLRHTLATLRHPGYCLYVGTYPNDRATIDAVAAVAESDDRVRLVIGSRPGPTTKADCLNTVWRALAADIAGGAPPVVGVVLHDAEDVVHPEELGIFADALRHHAAVQLPVLPLIHPRSRWISAHYADEFAEAHGKQLVVRQALGAGLPLAGVGCAIAWPVLARIAEGRAGPFDADSLTEDYELGLRVAELGGRGVLARVRPAPGAPVAMVRAYFPGRIDAAVRQKARWMTGIALAGWDRIGWGRWHDIGEHWMRMRDRRAPVAVLVLAAAYLALVTGALAWAGHWLLGTPARFLSPLPRLLLLVNAGLLGWRLVMRAAFTGVHYGPAEAARSVPRMVVGNIVAMLAARRALGQYLRLLYGRPLHWDKTDHLFPAQPAEDAR